MQKKPSRWNVTPALIAPNARSLWRGVAFVAPLWQGAGKGALLNATGQPVMGSDLVAGSTSLWRGTPYGLGAGISGASNLLEQANFAPIVTSDGAGTGDFTTVCLANPIAEARGSFAVHQANNSARGMVLVLNGHINLASVSTRFSFTTRDAQTGVVTGAFIDDAIDGKYKLFGGRRTAAVVDAFVDGKVASTASGTIRDILLGDDAFAIGQNAINSDGRIDTGTNVVFAAGWNRALSDAEMHMLARDPFVMFRPVFEWRGVWTAAGGGDAVLDPSDLTDGLVFDTPALSQAHNLSAADTMVAQTLEPAGISQAHLFSAGELNSAFQFDLALLAMSSQGAPGFRTRIAGNSARRKSAASGSGSKSITE